MNWSKKNSSRVVIIGGGFAGLYTAQNLKHDFLEVILIDKRNFHLFQPLLYQVATGGLSPADIASPLRAILKNQKNVQVIHQEVINIDPVKKQVITPNHTIQYDFLVVASGSTHHYFGNSQWQKFAPGLKTIEDATHIRSKILQAFELAEIETNPEKRKELMTFVIVGGGPTGIEMAGAIGEMVLHTLKNDFRHISTLESTIFLVEAGERILPSFTPRLSQKAQDALKKFHINILTNAQVQEIKKDEVVVRGGTEIQTIRTSNVIWAAGVRASSLGERIASQTGSEIDKQGRLFVNEYCQLPGHPNFYVIGDLAHFKDQSGKPLPAVAPVAMQQGKYVAKTILKTLNHEKIKPFKYWDKGSLAVIGRTAAVAKLGKFQFSGYIAWLLWLFVHLMYLVEFENRLLVFIQWAFNYFTRNRSARLIAHDGSDTPKR